MRPRRLDIGRRAFLRLSSRFIKIAKNSNNKIKVITASATTNKTKKNNKVNIQPNKIQIKIPDCLFFFFALLQDVPHITASILQEQEGKGNNKLHKS